MNNSKIPVTFSALDLDEIRLLARIDGFPSANSWVAGMALKAKAEAIRDGRFKPAEMLHPNLVPRRHRGEVAAPVEGRKATYEPVEPAPVVVTRYPVPGTDEYPPERYCDGCLQVESNGGIASCDRHRSCTKAFFDAERNRLKLTYPTE
jgi:hypothetical protein